MADPNSPDHLSELNEKIHRRSFSPRAWSRTRLEPGETEVKKVWPEINPILPSAPITRPSHWLKWFFWLAAIFFAAALVVAAFIFWRGGDVVSEKDVAVTITGPQVAKPGEVTNLEIAIKNLSSVDMEGVNLTIFYPAGTRGSSDGSPLDRSDETIGSIARGQTITRSIAAIFYGAEQTTVSLKTRLNYRLTGANIIYEKNDSYDLTLGAAPVSISIATNPEVVAGDEVKFDVTVHSNATTPIKDLALLATYPAGFSFTSASLPPKSGNNLWSLGDLEPGGERHWQIVGTLSGQAEEVKSFHFVAEAASAIVDPNATQYGSQFQTVTIKESFVALSLNLDGNSTNPYPIGSGQNIKATLAWRNNLPGNINDVEIKLFFDGPALDKSSLKVPQGFYSSSDNTITWNSNYDKDLMMVAAGSGGQTDFSFTNLPLVTTNQPTIKNPTINLRIQLMATRVAEGFTDQTIKSELERQIKIESDFQLASRAVRSQGPFTNTGPIPPKVDHETTYTVLWSVINSINDVKNARVTAVLPPDVKWKGVYSPTTAGVTFDEESRTLTWDLGSIRAGTGPGQQSPAKELAFQIGLVPSANQLGSEPILVSNIVMTGTDVFTTTDLTRTKADLSTHIISDPTFKIDDGKVNP